MNNETAKEFREELINILTKNYGYTREEALIVLARIGDRLDGFTHEEAAARNPLERNE